MTCGDESSCGLLSEVDDDAIPELVRWLFTAHVHKLGDEKVIVHEELRFIVKKDAVDTDPSTGCWKATMTCFDVRAQMDMGITFTLAK